MPETALVQRLQTVGDLDPEDRVRLHDLCRKVEATPAKRDIISEGERPEFLHLITEGWAARYKIVRSGARQITAILIPGDFLDLHATVLGHMDHGVFALTPCRVAYIDSTEMDRLTYENRRLARALWWSTLVDEAILHDWVVNVGRRDAYERIAHLLCELHCRMERIGFVQQSSLALPLTQDELADATGLTPVHTNRMLQRLRGDGLIQLSGGMLTINNIDALQKAAGFDPSYLHIKRRVQ